MFISLILEKPITHGFSFRCSICSFICPFSLSFTVGSYQTRNQRIFLALITTNHLRYFFLKDLFVARISVKLNGIQFLPDHQKFSSRVLLFELIDKRVSGSLRELSNQNLVVSSYSIFHCKYWRVSIF